MYFVSIVFLLCFCVLYAHTHTHMHTHTHPDTHTVHHQCQEGKSGSEEDHLWRGRPAERSTGALANPKGEETLTVLLFLAQLLNLGSVNTSVILACHLAIPVKWYVSYFLGNNFT